MNTKEAIDRLEWARRQKFVLYIGEVGSEPFETIINLLQRGEKFEAMWEELNNKYSDKELCYILEELEQKYFPLTITIPKSVLYEPFETDGVDDITV